MCQVYKNSQRGWCRFEFTTSMDLSFKKITSKILSIDEEMNFDENLKKLIKFYEKSFELYKINKKTGT